MKEGQKFDKEQKAAAMKDANPSTWRIIRTKGELGQQVIVLIREHSKVEAPSWSEDRVPVWISDRKIGQADDGSHAIVYDAVFHPAVKARAASDKNIQRAIICLALDSISHTHGTVIDLKGWKVLKRAQAKQALGLPFSWQAQSHDGGSYSRDADSDAAQKLDVFGASPLLSELSSVANNPKPKPAPQSVLSEPAPAAPPKPCLIEVVSDLSTPNYRILDTDSDALVLEVDLPGVESVADVELDISEDTLPVHVSVQVDQLYELEVDLPGDLNSSAVKASFDKAQSILKLSIPK